MRRPISYRVLQAWARSALSVFYRRVDVTGADAVPPDGPVVFAVNHTNALGDVAIIVAARKEFPHFLAAALWWKRAAVRLLFRLGGVVPVYRPRDGFGTRANALTFEACYAALVDGQQLVIFPEGEMHPPDELHEVKTGAARIALDAVARAGAKGVVVVPVGLLYDDMGRFRSDVEIHFGRPIPIDHWIASYHENRHDTVRALTRTLRDALADAIAVDPDRETTVLVRRAATMADAGHDPSFPERNARRRRLLARGHDPNGLDALAGAVALHADRLSALGVGDDHPLESMPGDAHRRLRRELTLLAPVAAFGAVANSPVLLVDAGIARRLSQEGWQATAKAVAGTLLLPVVWSTEAAIGARRIGSRAAVTLTALGAVSGWATLGWLDRVRRFRRARRIERLEREQAALVAAAHDSRARLQATLDAIEDAAGGEAPRRAGSADSL